MPIKRMSEVKTIAEQLEDICTEICDHYCKYPNQPIPDGKTEDWLFTDNDSPCNNCPLSRLH